MAALRRSRWSEDERAWRKVEEIGNWIVDGDETVTWRADLKRFMIFSRRRVGWAEFSARLLSPLWRRCSTPGIVSLRPRHRKQSLSVIITRGARPRPFRSFRISRAAALAFLRHCTSTSRTKPSWSTARHSRRPGDEKRS